MAKTVNYTPEMTALAVTMYTSVREESEDCRSEMVNFIADELEKDPRSIRAKLSREGVYVAKVAKSKVIDGEPAKKIELASRLIAVAGVDDNKVDAERVAKMNKTDITAFITAFIAAKSSD